MPFVFLHHSVSTLTNSSRDTRQQKMSSITSNITELRERLTRQQLVLEHCKNLLRCVLQMLVVVADVISQCHTPAGFSLHSTFLHRRLYTQTAHTHATTTGQGYFLAKRKGNKHWKCSTAFSFYTRVFICFISVYLLFNKIKEQCPPGLCYMYIKLYNK